mmetsp:Transcript_129655/g.347724  ORF Transcript_129655/g.347724 Transcript_129655/m.347724 type:complete len:308 (-) Transcript_129655:81-1004(-)
MPAQDRIVAESVAVWALMLYDFGWCARWPTTAFLGGVLAMAMQLQLVASKRGEGVSFVNQLAMMVWLAGNLIWGSAELLWDDDPSAGWLADVRWLHGTSRYYIPAMGAACLLMLPTMALLCGFYLVRWARVRSCEEPYVCLQCLPTSVYEEIFIVPWLVMDSLWGLMDLVQLLRPEVEIHPLFGVSIAAGLVSITVQVDCLRRQAQLCVWQHAGVCLAELLWVAGNLMWLIMDYRDVVFEALCLFLLAAVLAVASSLPRLRCACSGGGPELPPSPGGPSGCASPGGLEAPGGTPSGPLLVEVARWPC